MGRRISARFMLDLRHGDLAEILRESRLERAIGVIYRPETERQSHYFHARLADQFDAVLHFAETRAVEPLERGDNAVAIPFPGFTGDGRRRDHALAARARGNRRSGAGLLEKKWARFGNYFQTRCPFCLARPVTPRVLIGILQGAILAALCLAGKAVNVIDSSSARRPCRTYAYEAGCKKTRALMTPRHAKRRFPP